VAEWSLGWTTNGTGDGIAAGYSQAKFTEMLEAWFQGDNTDEGVLQGFGSAFAISASGGSASPVTIQNGAAMVKGFFYRSDAAGTKNIPTPSVLTRVDRIVLRADWGSQTVRFERVAGSEGGGTPALTQTDNTTWEIPLATASITTGGVITLADQRVIVHPNIEIEAAQIASNAVGSAELADNAISPGHINNRTEIIDVQPWGGYNITDTTTISVGSFAEMLNGWPMPDNKDCGMYGSWVVPQRYVGAATFKAVLVGGASGNCYCNLTWKAGGNLESPSSIGTNAGYAGTAVSEGVLKEVFDLGNTGALDIGDHVWLYFDREGTNVSDTVSHRVYFRHFLVEYTADS
jgi:hypothetical protein